MKYWSLYNIAFSDKRSDRLKRHFLFWLIVFLYHLLRIGLMMPVINKTNIWPLLELTTFWGVVINMFLCYSVIYFLVPKYFQREKYILFVIGFILVYALVVLIGLVHVFILVGNPVSDAIGTPIDRLISIFRPGFIRLFGNPLLICGLFLSLKVLKNWHLEQLRTETLAKENTNAELQLLKAQVHPHFLFNTLNNIYSFTLNQSPLAGTLVQKLSDMLNYMIHECEKPLVPLDKEIKLIRNYMGLEKVRYGNRLNMQVEIKGNYENKMIAPLLMIPFVENCFKHGASIMRGQQWIKLNITINEDQLDFKLSNSKPPDLNGSNRKNGIGLANVQKRLQLLYPEKHFLATETSSDSYSVHLYLSLQQFPSVKKNKSHILIPKLQPA
jgi:hypothetical protein